MITEGILTVLKYIGLGLLTIIPGFGTQQIGSFAGLVELIANASIFVPFSTLLICLGIWISFHIFRFAISIANWVISKIPTIS